MDALKWITWHYPFVSCALLLIFNFLVWGNVAKQLCTQKGIPLQRRKHSSNGPHTVAVVSLAYGDTCIDYSLLPWEFNRVAAYVNAANFEREFRETTYLFHEGTGPEQFQGAHVLDKRPAIDRWGAKCVIDSPMLDAPWLMARSRASSATMAT